MHDIATMAYIVHKEKLDENEYMKLNNGGEAALGWWVGNSFNRTTTCV